MKWRERGFGREFWGIKRDSTWFKTRAKLVREIRKDCEGVESFASELLSTLNPAHF